jgi:hypothetical protein
MVSANAGSTRSREKRRNRGTAGLYGRRPFPAPA